MQEDTPDEEEQMENVEAEDDAENTRIACEKLLADHALDPNEGVFDSDNKVVSAAGRGVGLRFVGTYFHEAKSDLRIASSYFTLRGYDLSRRFIEKDTKVSMLVGQKEGKKATQAIVREFESVVHNFLHELGTTPVPLADAVKALIRRIREGKFVFRSVREIRADGSEQWRRFHCKFYIADEAVVWTGSANFTNNGLSRFGNNEQLTASRDAGQIEYFRRFYDEQIASSHALLGELREVLEQWLEMHDPFQAYIKALLCLFGTDRYGVEKPANKPTYFQEVVIVRAVSQARRYGGALLLVATGLGKTVMGAEIARRLLTNFDGNTVHRLVVVAPRVTEKGWCDELKGRGCSPEQFFDNMTLFKAASDDDNNQASLLEQCIEQCNSSTVFLIDEAHRYRNLISKTSQINKRNSKRKAEQLERIINRVDARVEKIAERGGKIILLTATPYGTQTQNINSLLRMLPPTSPTASDRDKNLFKQTGTFPWHVAHANKTAQLVVVTVLGMLHVLRMALDRGDIEEMDGRIFLAMSDGSKKYLPYQIRFHRISYPLLLQEQMERAHDAKAFAADTITYYQ